MEIITNKMDSPGGLPPPPPYSNGTSTPTTTVVNNKHLNTSDNHSNSVSPGSVSNRSSTSSLNNGIQSIMITPGETAHNHIHHHHHHSSSASKRKSDTKKVSICDVKPVLKREKSSTSTLITNYSSSGSNRTSLIRVQDERKARKVRFFINGDKFFKGAIIAVSSEKFRTFDKLLEHLTRIMCNQVTLPNGVRYVFNIEGKILDDVVDLGHGGNYLCSSYPVFKKLEYLKLAQEQESHQWNKMKRETYYLGMNKGGLRRDAYKLSGHSKSFGQSNKSLNESDKFVIKPKIIAVLRSGLRPRKAVRVLLNNRNTKSFDNILADLTNIVKLDTGAVRKVFSLTGKPVVAVQDFAEGEVFIAYGMDKCVTEDFDLDLIEFRGVQSILKSPELDAKYEKYSAASPKTSRRKFLSSRVPAKGGRKASKSRPSPSRNLRQDPDPLPSPGSDSRRFPLQQQHPQQPREVTSKYEIGEIIGDGNFAVVRKCVSRKTKKTYALKIIDKSKCLGKEHMIDSEVTILSVVNHPHIIELIEVFDLPDEKYLVTEYVPGGDLFDAIAMDTKYSEDVSRTMVSDLTSALKFLHDKMIVHRDIKPENLLVFEKSSDKKKSLKLGDFGLAQVVSEPLFTVCGTPTYVAPEILAETGYGVKVDIWATGVIMYILLCGFPPFSSRTNNQEELFDQILSGLFEFNSPDWDEISYPAKELISWMLQVDPLQRFSAYEILQHPWIIITP